MERVLPEVLAEEHAFWEYESLDGILPELARKSGHGQVELLGLCILMSDYSLTPVHARLGIAGEADEFAWLDCKIGERGEGHGGLTRIPYDRLTKELFRVGQRVSDITWAYTVLVGSPPAPDFRLTSA